MAIRYKKILIYTLISLLVLLVSVVTFWFVYNANADQQQRVSPPYRMNEKDVALLQDGDIILRRGYGLVSDMIGETLSEKYDVSHVAIIRKEADTFKVIQTISSSISDFDGMQCQSLQSFVHDSKINSVVVVRYKHKNSTKDNSYISNSAQAYLDRKVPFDESFDLKDTTTLFCSELVYRVILKEYKDDIFDKIDKGSVNKLGFVPFFDTSRFDVILNHQLKKKK
ncbi:MAG: YiiX/YebB-like N1pC/P60 family cysteine hydrolase [Bacteroidota bacterium]